MRGHLHHWAKLAGNSPHDTAKSTPGRFMPKSMSPSRGIAIHGKAPGRLLHRRGLASSQRALRAPGEASRLVHEAPSGSRYLRRSFLMSRPTIASSSPWSPAHHPQVKIRSSLVVRWDKPARKRP
jgi:hypothetical protein